MSRVLRPSAAMLAVFLFTACGPGPAVTTTLGQPFPSRALTFSQLADDAVLTIRTRWYAQGSYWFDCDPSSCFKRKTDWGVDSMLDVLYERWYLTGDVGDLPIFRSYETMRRAPLACTGSCLDGSDLSMWDSVAAVRMYDVTHDPALLVRAEDEYDALGAPNRFAQGACPQISYQLIDHVSNAPAAGGLKTLETDANRILAGALLAQRELTIDPRSAAAARHLQDARALYDAVRQTFFDTNFGLYTVYATDDARGCNAIPQRFFASVNGVMIEAGLELTNATHDPRFLADARAAAGRIAQLADARGIFADLQADNDIVQPLVLAMVKLVPQEPSALNWIVRNAAAAANTRNAEGSYGRFFDGPPPAPGAATIWQTNGGFALMVAAGYYAPAQRSEAENPWSKATTRAVSLSDTSSYAFTGSGIALLGTLGETCRTTKPPYPGDNACESGHAHLILDGQPMADQTGIWQNKDTALSSSQGYEPLANSILFAWRWPASGQHLLQFQRGDFNVKEGASFVDVGQVMILP